MIKIEIESNTGTHQQNEDYTANLQLSDTCYAVAVADGMGGLENGEIASKTAVDTFNKYVQAHYKDTEKQDCIHQALYEADKAIANLIKEFKGRLGCSIAVAVTSTTDMWYSWQGDVRIYLIRNKKPTQLTQDHNLDTGYELRLTRCLKGNGLREDIPFKHHKLSEGDKILICTDGYYKHDDSDDSTTMTITI